MHSETLRDNLSEQSLKVASEALGYLEEALPDASVKDLIAAYTAATRVYKEIESLKPEVVEEKSVDPLTGYNVRLADMVSKLASNHR